MPRCPGSIVSRSCAVRFVPRLGRIARDTAEQSSWIGRDSVENTPYGVRDQLARVGTSFSQHVMHYRVHHARRAQTLLLNRVTLKPNAHCTVQCKACVQRL
jgi:hypothetical protein